jgi:4-hydroxy-3-methylbut-2-enyl diphosphate reductase IspH
MALTVLLASPRSFCAGVERAIAVVEQLLEQRYFCSLELRSASLHP